MTLAKKKIPLIDNDPASTRRVRLTPERMPTFAGRESDDPTKAVRTAREFQRDLVPRDVERPEMGGGEVARNFQTDPKSCARPIIFVTSLVTGEETAKLLRGVAEQPGVLCAWEERDTAAPVLSPRG